MCKGEHRINFVTNDVFVMLIDYVYLSLMKLTVQDAGNMYQEMYQEGSVIVEAPTGAIFVDSHYGLERIKTYSLLTSLSLCSPPKDSLQ